MPDDFVSAALSPRVRGFFCRTLPLALPRLGVVGVDYQAHDLERLRALKNERVLLVPNHPTNVEPALLFDLSCRVDQPFHFLACREAFEPLWGAWGQVIRRVGAFSVVRGTTDRASLRAMRDLLARPGAKLVAFPEGEVYSQNDTLLPFNTGVFQIAFWALEDAHKAAGEAASGGGTNSDGGAEADPPPSLLVLPIAIKYRFTRDMGPAIRAALARLERFNALPTPCADDPYTRLRKIGLAMLRSVEREYRLKPPAASSDGGNNAADADLTPRLVAIKEAILERVALGPALPCPKPARCPNGCVP
jgi:1-acyl-sn-glycerol-3-phosphate acyltransferase